MIAAAAAWPAGVLLAQDDSARPRHKISAAALHQALSARFPLRFGLTGILGIEVSAPRLHLLASRNLPHVLVVEPRQADPVSLVHFDRVLITRPALAQVQEMLA